ncbi:MAG: MutT/nudix family phosphohydrolase [Candidatus Giovannonibacteria bacterium GW2011_GWA2_53_7]|uniref:MutT/nudix family phosphohydrolase n=1 Tax=Candidatus Giovannonibacteria bacterium GW2011_GWA2_53_7 TaxID=1618650 RepID=A0A0G1Y1Q5_9BACT|nr:MAG: MutT/nudix family phosphohydrolase [Candidatus Giovannonibacteria bacterium GW2011_GWA2_53_7]
MRASAVLIKDGNILLMHRTKIDRDYFVLPGGSLENGESLEEAVVREAKEETGFDVEIKEKLGEIYDERNERRHHLFRVEILGGELGLGSPEKERNCKENGYGLEWHALDHLPSPLYPDHVERLFLNA